MTKIRLKTGNRKTTISRTKVKAAVRSVKTSTRKASPRKPLRK